MSSSLFSALILLSLLAVAHGNSKAVTVTAAAGSTVTLKTSHNGTGVLQTQWTRGPSNSFSILVTATNSTMTCVSDNTTCANTTMLQITNASSSDSGMYGATTTKTDNTGSSESFNVSVFSVAAMPSLSTESVIVSDTWCNLTLTCTYSPSPDQHVQLSYCGGNGSCEWQSVNKEDGSGVTSMMLCFNTLVPENATGVCSVSNAVSYANATLYLSDVCDSAARSTHHSTVSIVLVSVIVVIVAVAAFAALLIYIWREYIVPYRRAMYARRVARMFYRASRISATNV